MTVLDLHIMAPFVKYSGTLEGIRTRDLMYSMVGPYLKNRNTKPKDLMPLPIDQDIEEINGSEHTTAISGEEVSWWKTNKEKFEQMLIQKH